MYIVLEGIDGVGKSSQIKLLEEYLEKKNISTKSIVEPTDSEIGQLIRKELLKSDATEDINQQMLALLFAADRLTLKKEILEVKNSQDKFIISDRSFYSSICYQNNPTVTTQWIRQVNMHTPRPDLTILLDLDEKESIKRCDGVETFENTEFLEKTRQNYIKLLQEESNMIKVDANQSIDEVHEDIIKIIKEKMKC